MIYDWKQVKDADVRASSGVGCCAPAIPSFGFTPPPDGFCVRISFYGGCGRILFKNVILKGLLAAGVYRAHRRAHCQNRQIVVSTIIVRVSEHRGESLCDCQ